MTLTIDDAREFTAAAREREAQPRVHPNGFIQLDLKPPADERWHEGKQAGHSGADLRLHVWNPPGIVLPHQDTVNEIHDHVFDMFSTVVRGTLVQSLYEFIIGGIDPGSWTPYPLDHELYRAVYDKNSSSRLEQLGVIGHLRRVVSYPITSAARHPEYMQKAFTLHDSDGGDETVVTLMQKQAVHEGIPTVVCPIGEPPDNDFDRATAAPQDLLWEAIERSLA